MLEIRCIECGWLDPKLWSCYTQCGCNHYFRAPVEIKGHQMNLKFTGVLMKSLPYHIWSGDYS